jgi:hypothetical protein
MPSKPTLRRSVTPWGSFSWGYSDVGADIFVGLGLVLGAAGGGSNVAFLFAGIVPSSEPSDAVTNEFVPMLTGFNDERLQRDSITRGTTAAPTNAATAAPAATTKKTVKALHRRPRRLLPLLLPRRRRRRRLATTPRRSMS